MLSMLTAELCNYSVVSNKFNFHREISRLLTNFIHIVKGFRQKWFLKKNNNNKFKRHQGRTYIIFGPVNNFLIRTSVKTIKMILLAYNTFNLYIFKCQLPTHYSPLFFCYLKLPPE